MIEYFWLGRNGESDGSWFLGAPMDDNGVEIDPRIFSRCQKFQGDRRLSVPVVKQGRQKRLNFGYSKMLIIEKNLASAIEKESGANIQRISVDIPSTDMEFEIVNCVDCLDCVDEEQSEYARWKAGDFRPEMIGQYRMIYKLVVDPARVLGHHLFRVKGAEMMLICSSKIRRLLDDVGETGITYYPVGKADSE